MADTLRIGTRGSQLALWQANHVAELLRANGHAVEVEVIRTAGDRMQDPASSSPGGSAPNGTGIFIKEIEDALLAGRIDLAVHSLKDLPTQITPGLTLAAIPPRADARDAFVCEEHWGLHTLPSGSRIATTSPRRQAMILALRPDVTFVEMRGNIDTRLRKWSEGEADALVLASAGLDRLGLTEHVHQRFAVDELTPAPGQGALALQVRCPNLPQHCHPNLPQHGHPEPRPYCHPEPPQHGHPEPPPYCHPEPKAKDLLLASDGTDLSGGDALKGTGFIPSVEDAQKNGALAPEGKGARDAAIHAIIRTLNCSTAEYAVTAERAVLHALGGGCQLPLGAYAHLVDDHWHLHAMVVSPDGDQVAHVLHKSPLTTPAEELGQQVAAALKARGALELLGEGVVISTEA